VVDDAHGVGIRIDDPDVTAFAVTNFLQSLMKASIRVCPGATMIPPLFAQVSPKTGQFSRFSSFTEA